MTDFYETRVEILEPKKIKNLQQLPRNQIKENPQGKNYDFYSSVIESSEELSVEYKLTKKYCILNKNAVT